METSRAVLAPPAARPFPSLSLASRCGLALSLPSRRATAGHLSRLPARRPRTASLQIFALSISSSGGEGDASWQREEERWLREERRWLREEERWERERERWQREREDEEERWDVAKEKTEAEKEELRRERDRLLLQVEALKEILMSTVAGGDGFNSTVDVEVHLRALGLGPATGRSIDAPAARQTLPQAYQAHLPPPVSPALVPSALPSSPQPLTSALTSSSGSQLQLPPEVDNGVEAAAPGTPPSNLSSSQSSSKDVNRRTLRVGCEGDDVQEMQNALALQGFYCGEDDEENAFFSTSTESAVKTWQATMRVPEDGSMTPALLSLLLGEDNSSSASPSPQTLPHLTPPLPISPLPSSPALAPPPLLASSPPPTREHPEFERYARSSLEMGEHRVFLLGENRWEDPSRLQTNPPSRTVNGVTNPEVAKGKVGGMRLALKHCLQCRGDGRMVCMECDGTGDLNVEEQFLDWVGEENPRCMYCDGIGAITCDLCDGSGQAEG